MSRRLVDMENKTDSTLKGYGFLVFYLVMLSAPGSFVNDMFTPALPAMRRAFGLGGGPVHD